MCEVYERIATDFSDQRGTTTWPWIAEFLDGLADGSDVLDVGCGNGRNMQDPRHSFTGVDNCERFVAICKARGRRQLRHGL